MNHKGPENTKGRHTEKIELALVFLSEIFWV